jgi:tRNA-dihydrouridine synthase B
MMNRNKVVVGELLINRILLSPLESVSDIGFRSLCFKNGAGITWTEMIRAQGIIKKNKSTLDLIDTFHSDNSTGLQLMVKSASELKAALGQLECLSMLDDWKHFKNIAAIDLNFGCPSTDIIREGGGPALLKRRTKLIEIFNELANWKSTKSTSSNILNNIKAVGCKIRLGLNSKEQENKVYLNVIEAANSCGLDYVTVHARHARQKSSDKPTWLCIKEIKNISTIPIFGNGNIVSVEDAIEMMKMTGCDGVMVAREAIKNPWVFKSFISNSSSSSSGSSGNNSSKNDISNYDKFDLFCYENFVNKNKLLINNNNNNNETTVFNNVDYINNNNNNINSNDNNNSNSDSNINIINNNSNYWPTKEEILIEKTNYLELSQKHKTKEKFVKFHENNFERILTAVETRNFNLNFLNPKNLHFS